MIEIETITENASSYFCEQIRRTGTRGMFPIDLHHEAMQSLLADIEKVVVVKDTDNDFRAALSALAGELNADEDSLVMDISGAAAGNLPPMDMDCLEAIDQILFVQKDPQFIYFRGMGNIRCSCLTFTCGVLRKEK